MVHRGANVQMPLADTGASFSALERLNHARVFLFLSVIKRSVAMMVPGGRARILLEHRFYGVHASCAGGIHQRRTRFPLKVRPTKGL